MTHKFSIGGHGVWLTFTEGQTNDLRLVPSLRVFAVDDISPALHLTVDDTLRPEKISDETLIRDFDTGNGMTRVDRLADGGYQYICRDIKGNPCCLLKANANFSIAHCALKGNDMQRTFGLTNAMMLTYAFCASFFDTLLIHASCLRYEGKAYAFTAKSGTGKSTHVAMWLSNIEGVDMVNDDNPILRFEEDGKAYIYGSPWSGKTPCYRQLRVPLGAVSLIKRAKKNSCVPIDELEALGVMLSACSSMRWDRQLSDNLYSTLSKLLSNYQCYQVNCLPNADAALTAKEVLTVKRLNV